MRRIRPTHARRWLASLVVPAMVLAGYSPSDASQPSAESRDVSVQLYQAPTTFSPIIPGTGSITLLGQLHFDALVGINSDREVEPRLAESFESSPDARTWTFHLVDGVRWSDGETFDADDVLASFHVFGNPDTGSSVVARVAEIVGGVEFSEGSADTIAGITAPDPLTVVIELVEPNAAYPATLAEPLIFMMPEHVLSTLPTEGMGDDPYWREPTVGVGPFVFSRWVSEEEVELVANPEYRTELGVDRVFAQFLSTEAALARLEAGDLDFAQVAALETERVEGMAGVTLHRAEGSAVMAAHTAVDSGKLADPRVRQAFLYAIDRQAIVDELLNGEGRVVDTLIFGPEWAMPDDLVSYGYDPDKARQLLEEAGWDSGTEVQIEFQPGQIEREQLATIASAQLQAVGINAVPTPYEAAAMRERITNRQFDALLSVYGLFNVDPALMNTRLMCDQAAPNGANLTAYCNPELDELLVQGMATTDEAERAEIYADAQRLVNAEVPILVMYSPNMLAATSDRLGGFDLAPIATQAFWNAEDWTVEG